MNPEIVIAVVVAFLFIGAWIYRRKNPAKYSLPLNYEQTRDLAWEIFEDIYRKYGVRREVDLRFKTADQMPSDHPLVAWWRGTDIIALNIESAKRHYWFAAELHNVYRYRIGLPYPAVEKEDIVNHRLVVVRLLEAFIVQ